MQPTDKGPIGNPPTGGSSIVRPTHKLELEIDTSGFEAGMAKAYEWLERIEAKADSVLSKLAEIDRSEVAIKLDIENVTIKQEMDIRALSKALARELKRGMK